MSEYLEPVVNDDQVPAADIVDPVMPFTESVDVPAPDIVEPVMPVTDTDAAEPAPEPAPAAEKTDS
jgi:hypothetical protein